MEENLESLFSDVFTDEPAAAAQEAPADDNGQQASTDSAAQEEAQKPAQDAETNAKQAADRRRREQREREREARAYQAAWKDASDLVAELGIEDEAGNTVADMDALRKLAEDRRKERVSRGSPTEADIRHIVDERMRETAKPAEPQLSDADRQRVDQQLAQIRQMDPAMVNLDAILQSEAGDKFRDYVSKGLDFVDAYTLAAKDRLAGINANRSGAKGGKDHLTGTSQRGTGGIDVPSDVMALYRELDPDMSEAEIREHYNADRKQFGR